jgi:protocatechuate 3,4-dioxygenase beta subunit
MAGVRFVVQFLLTRGATENKDLYEHSRKASRRAILKGLACIPVFGLASCEEGSTSPTAGSTPNPTPAPVSMTIVPTASCTDDDDPTPPQTEGPYFTPRSPLRTSLLESRTAGTRLTLSGQVFSTACQPVAQALLDFWQCDSAGDYDNSGFRLRGHQLTDASGRYVLGTVVPGLYPGRTRHVHVKVQAPNRPVLTTQLYFPGEPRNASDGIFNADLLIAQASAGGVNQGTFNFVVQL